MSFRNCIILLLATLIGGVAQAQTINSPYSNYGLGEISFDGLTHNYGSGEAGIAMPSHWHINLQNPSLLINNNLSSFQVGLMGDVRNYQSEDESADEVAVSLRFLAMSYPIVKGRWTVGIALTPFSSAKYNTFSSDTLRDGLVNISRFSGEGGLSQFVWANGFRVYKSLALGVKATYVFGLIERRSELYLTGDDVTPSSSVAYLNATAYSDFLFSLSASYKLKLSDRRFLNFGAVYDFSQEVSGEQDIQLQRLGTVGQPIGGHVLADDESVSYTLPISYGAGVSYESLNKLKVGFDFTYKNWQDLNNAQESVGLRNTYKIAAGAAWTPDIQSVNSYLKRVTYRLGFNVNQSPYLVNNTEINDFGINFGASFPVSGYSSMDAAFKFGQRGTISDNLIKENYFQVIIGATINDQWFIKRRYD